MPGAGRRNSSLVAAGIGLSRIAGFARDRAIAHFIGVGAVFDAFTAAVKIPNLMQNLLGEGVLSASFIPVYSRLLAEGREEEAGRVAGAIAGLLTLVAGVLVVAGVAFAQPITAIVAPGFTPQDRALTVRLVQILTPGIGFLVLSAWCLGVLNSHRRFFLSYVAPVVWNAAQIAALVTLGLAGAAGAKLAVALAWGALAGGLLQFAVQLPAVWRLMGGVRPSLRLRLPGVRATVRAFGPVVAGRGVVQLLSYVELLLASLLAAGALSALGLAQRLYLLPISLFGMSVAAAELPDLSGRDRGDRQGLQSQLDDGLARVAFYVVPSAMAFVVLGDLIVAGLYRTGAFDQLDVILVWLVLVGYTAGLLANTSARLLQSALYADHDTRTPAVVAAVRVLVGAAAGAFLMLQLDRVELTGGGLTVVGELPAWSPLPVGVRDALRADPSLRLGAVGLSLAAGASAWLEWALLRARLARRLVIRPRTGGGNLARTAGAASAAAAVGLAVRWVVSGLHPLPGALVAVTLTGVVYLVAARALGLPEALRAWAWVQRRGGSRSRH